MGLLNALQTEAWVTLGILLITLILLVTNKVRIDLIGLFILLALGIGGLVKEEELFAGFGSEAVIVIAAMLAIGEAMVRTGVADAIAAWLTRIGGQTERRLILVTMLLAGLFSSFISDLAIVAIFLPVVLGFEQRVKVPASRLLLPLALASTLGGLISMIGSSSNIVANQVLIEFGIESLSLFSIAPLGHSLLNVGTVFVWLFRRFLLPKNAAVRLDDKLMVGVQEYLTELRINEGSSWADHKVRDIAFFKDYGINVVRILRKRPIGFIKADTILRQGDILLVEARRDDLLKLQSTADFSVLPHVERVTEGAGVVQVGEALIRQGSELVGRTLQEVRLRERYDVAVLAVWRDGHALTQRLATTELHSGDMLLLQGSGEQMSDLAEEEGLLMISQKSHRPHTRKKGPYAVGILVLMLLLTALNILPITVSSILGVGLLIVLQILTMNQIYRAIEWHILVFIAAMIPLATAMKETGLIDLMSQGIVALVGNLGPYALLAVTFWLAGLTTQVLSNTATALLLAPVVIGAAQTMGVNPVPFVVGIIAAVSASPITYVSHKVYLVIMAPGGYKFRDYLKFGIPLTLVSFLVTMLIVPLLWPF